MISGLDVLTLALSFFAPLLIYPRYIDYMRKVKIGQYIREEGPSAHGTKAGTPTAGGLVFVPAAALALAILGVRVELILATVLYASVGLVDDLLSVTRKRSLGLRAWQKLALQLAFAALIARGVLRFRAPAVLGVEVPRWFFYVFAVLLISGYSNATNLTDGLDGLAGWTFLSSAALLAIWSNDLESLKTLLSFSFPVLAFLVYNTKPARVFMGDTGSLALGAFLSTYALVRGWELQLLLFTAIFLVETLSVMAQVFSYKVWRRRVFRMTPLHHHFELGGWSEEKIVGVFVAWNVAIGLLSLVVLRSL